MCRFFSFLIAICFVLLGSQCSRYSQGFPRLTSMKDVKILYIETFKNNTYFPRGEVMLTSEISQIMASDGVYVLASDKNKADAILSGELVSVSQRQIRSERYNTYKSLETGLLVKVHFKLTDKMGTVLKEGHIDSESSFFNQGKQESERRDAYSYAVRSLANQIRSKLF